MKIHQTFRLEEGLVEEAKKYAEKENRALSNVYATAVKAFLKNNKPKKQS